MRTKIQTQHLVKSLQVAPLGCTHMQLALLALHGLVSLVLHSVLRFCCNGRAQSRLLPVFPATTTSCLFCNESAEFFTIVDSSTWVLLLLDSCCCRCSANSNTAFCTKGNQICGRHLTCCAAAPGKHHRRIQTLLSGTRDHCSQHTGHLKWMDTAGCNSVIV